MLRSRFARPATTILLLGCAMCSAAAMGGTLSEGSQLFLRPALVCLLPLQLAALVWVRTHQGRSIAGSSLGRQPCASQPSESSPI